MKARLIILILSLMPTAGIQGLEQGKERWNLARQEEGFLLWKLKDDSSVIGTLQSTRRAKSINWDSVDSEKVFKDVADKKREVLALMGVNNWNPSHYSWQKRKGHHELIVEGSYTDHRLKKTRFREHHFFFPREDHQVLVIFPENKKMPKGVIKRFVDRAKRTLATL